MRILLVEDDKLLGDGITIGLNQENHIVDWVTDGITAEYAIIDGNFDAVILDIGLPKKSGLEVLASIRRKGISTPVLILTARDSVEDRIKGLDAGADDYLSKPFDLHELTARLRAVIRRSTGGRANPLIEHSGISIDPAAHAVTFEGEELHLPRREFDLLHMLLISPGKVVSRNQMIENLYGWNEEIDSNALEVHIHNLRKKFGTTFIRTIRGVGYMVQKESTQT